MDIGDFFEKFCCGGFGFTNMVASTSLIWWLRLR